MRALPWLGSELTGGLPPCDHPRTSAHASGHGPGRVPFGHWASHPRGARNGPWGCSLPHLPHSLSRHGGRRQLAAPVPSMALLLRAWWLQSSSIWRPLKTPKAHGLQAKATSLKERDPNLSIQSSDHSKKPGLHIRDQSKAKGPAVTSSSATMALGPGVGQPDCDPVITWPQILLSPSAALNTPSTFRQAVSIFWQTSA